MATIKDGICANSDNSISFGDYTAVLKIKVDNFSFAGNLYKIRTHNLVTRLEKNEKLLIEAVPGATLHNFLETEKAVSFSSEGTGDTKFTLELEPDKEYRLSIDDVFIANMFSGISGKVTFSAEIGGKLTNFKID